MTCCSSLLRGSVLATRAAFCKVYAMNSYQEASMSSMSRRHQKIGLITVCLCISSSTNCDLESDRGKVDWRDVFPNWMEIQTAHLFTPCFVPSAFALLLVWVLWVTSQLASSCLRSHRPMAFDPGEEAVNSVSSLPAQTQGGRSLEYVIQLEVTRAVVCATSLVNTQTGLLYIPETDAEVCSASQTDAHSRVMGYI